MEERAPKERYTYKDYLTWDDGLRWELIDGEAFCLGPGPDAIRRVAKGKLIDGEAFDMAGPGTIHQTVAGNLSGYLLSYFQGKECRVYFAPFDVMLAHDNEPEGEIDTVVQPDIMILCDKSKLRRKGIKGAPDVVFEILSPSTGRRDLADKLYAYERAGVKEYMIVDTDKRIITAYRRDKYGGDGCFSRRAAYTVDDVLEFSLFPELKIPLSTVFEEFDFPTD